MYSYNKCQFYLCVNEELKSKLNKATFLIKIFHINTHLKLRYINNTYSYNSFSDIKK